VKFVFTFIQKSISFFVFAQELAHRPNTFYMKWDEQYLPLLDKKGSETS